jgi:hypothetical protein
MENSPESIKLLTWHSLAEATLGQVHAQVSDELSARVMSHMDWPLTDENDASLDVVASRSQGTAIGCQQTSG